ncbi:Six-hairpin glycosidase-like protein [Aspergillus karnatakaensis]|uniref:Six-hairpin glycosidase-like protein n=1 Tax=Aspergillus karnatakaensis TaxID=1810916 RepID=UPI003CCD3E76
MSSMLLFNIIPVVLAGIALVHGLSFQSRTSNHADFVPVSLHVGGTPSMPFADYHEFTLETNSPIATLDYGTHVAGLPIFEISALSGQSEIELKYSEQFSGLYEPLSDGPSTFVAIQVNPGRITTVRLLTNGTVSFRSVGFTPTTAPPTIEDLPGTFESSNPRYNEIWNLGARAVSLACYDSGTQTSIWDVSAQGAFVSSSVPSYSVAGYNFSDYTLEFDAQIVRGGLQWSLAYNFGICSRGGIQLNLAGNYPAESTFKNTNQTLFPPSTLALGYGVAFVNQTTLNTYFLDKVAAPSSAVAINHHPVFSVSLSSYYVGAATPIVTVGSFGFGAWQDQSGLFRNVVAHDTVGSLIYENPLTNATQVLPEYGVQKNAFSTCVDGGRRDRLVWSGDFVHTVRIISTTSGRADHIRGTFEQLFAYQLRTGQFPMLPSLGYFTPCPSSCFRTLISFVDYMRSWDDIEIATEYWDSLQQAVTWLSQHRNNSTGLIDLSRYVTSFLGPTEGVAVNGAAVEALTGMSKVASAIGDHSSAAEWQSLATSIKQAVNTRLWNDKLGVYSVSSSSPDDFSVAGIAFAITSGVANRTQALSALSHLPTLQLGPGYKDATTVNSFDPTVNLSPNTNGFLLPALIQYGQIDSARFLLENLWDAMIADNSTYSGASWEYVNQDRKPGLDQYTSLTHPWGGAATYALSQYVAGIRPVEFGYRSCVIEPAFLGFDLDRINASVPTPYGEIRVYINIEEAHVVVGVKAPRETEGEVRLRKDWVLRW